MPLNLIFIQPGNYTIDDNGIPGDNISVIRDGNGVVIFTFGHPADALGFTVSTPGVHITVNFTDSMNAANFTIGSLNPDPMVGPPQSPDSIVMENIQTTGTVTLVSNTTITEGLDVDAGIDIQAGALVMSAVSGIGTALQALETRTGLFEAETTTGGININNIGSVQIGGVVAEVDGLDVVTSGNINFINTGSIFLTEANSVTAAEVVHGGSTSGNVVITAFGANSDIFGNVDNGAVTVPRGSLTITAGRDIQFGTVGSDFNNDIITSNSLTLLAGRDILIDGFADILSDNFGLDTGGDLTFAAGRNIAILNVAGTSASVTASGSGGADAIFTTGFGGSLTVNGPGSFALGSTSGNVLINADRLLIDGASGISAPSGQVAIQTRTAGREIILGSGSDASLAIELSDIELDRIFAQDLFIGNDNSGRVRVIAPVTMTSPGNAPDLFIRSGDNINIRASLTVSGDLSLRAGGDVAQSAATIIDADTVTVEVDFNNPDPGLGNAANFAGTFVLTGASTITGAGDNDTLVGNGAANTISGLAGNDTIRGNGGNDFLAGGAGADVIEGGGGVDTADYTGNFGGVSVNLATGVGLFNFAQGDTLTDIENVNGTEFDDILTGSTVANVLNGNGGADTISGGDGNDTISGGAGADNLNGGIGTDTLTYAGHFGGVSIDLQAGTGLFNFAQGDVLSGFENVLGTEFGDILQGDGGNNRLEGNGQNDQLVGRAGNDILDGGLGSDSLDGGLDVDTADYSGEFGGVSINLATGTGLFNSAQGDTLTSIEKVIGTSFGDIFESNSVTNFFTGGDGNDIFRFNAGFSQDVITDFVGNGAAAGDTVRFAAGLFTDFADMIASSAQVGADVVITLDPANILTLQGVTLAALDSSDFFYS